MIDINAIDFNKNHDNLVPVIIQDNATLQVLMLGFMNKPALEQTLHTKKVTFFSRTKNRLWVKGESSNNFLHLESIYHDCDNDTLLIMATPQGPTCHNGTTSCFAKQELPALSHIGYLDKVIQDRISSPSDTSYTNQLIARGLNKVAQKVGEEGVEVVIAALNETTEEYLGEMTDLIYHMLVLLHAKQLNLSDVAGVIAKRHQQKTQNEH